MNQNQVNATNPVQISQSDLNLSGSPTDITGTQVHDILNMVYLLAGIVAVLMIVLGGIRYVTSNGDSSQIQSAKNQITYAVVGLVVVIMAAAITQFVITNVTK